MKDGRTAGRKWAVEDANFEQLWRMAEYSRKDYANLDMVSDTRPLYSFSEPSLGDIIGYTTDETLEELIGTNADDDHRDKIRELLESARESERLHHARARRLESSLTLAI
jgi:beta-lactamase superfamily II metal-dependent hydrolase